MDGTALAAVGLEALRIGHATCYGNSAYKLRHYAIRRLVQANNGDHAGSDANDGVGTWRSL